MFIGRQQELNTLSKLYHSGKFEFAVIYGRRCQIVLCILSIGARICL